MPLRVDHAADLLAFVGTERPPSDEFTLTQADVDHFVEISGDRQWIHSDAKRARAELPAGRTIVPGNLLLAQVPRLLQQIYLVERFDKCLVAGYRDVRFRQAVSTGARLRLHATFLSVTPARAFVRVETQCRLDLLESAAPALTAVVTDLFYG